MMPHVHAVEYQQVKETQESLIDLQFDNLIRSDSESFGEEITQSLQNAFNEKSIKNFNEAVHHFSTGQLVSMSESIFDDPGNGTDGNGPDDITDYMYLIIHVLLHIPVSFVQAILSVISLLLTALVNLISSVITFFVSLIEPLLGFLVNVLNFIVEIVQLMPGLPFILVWVIIGIVVLFFIYLFYFLKLSLFLFELFLPIIELIIRVVFSISTGVHYVYTSSYMEAYDYADVDGDGR